MNKKGILLGTIVKFFLILVVIFIIVSAFLKAVAIGKSGVNTGIGFLDNLLSSKGSPIKDVSFSFENGNIILNTNFKENFKGVVKTNFWVYLPSNSNNPIKIGENTQDFSKSDKKEVKVNIPLDHFKNDLFSKLEIELLDESKKEENTNPKVLYKETYFVVNPSVLMNKNAPYVREQLFNFFACPCFSNKDLTVLFSFFSHPLQAESYQISDMISRGLGCGESRNKCILKIKEYDKNKIGLFKTIGLSGFFCEEFIKGDENTVFKVYGTEIIYRQCKSDKKNPSKIVGPVFYVYEYGLLDSLFPGFVFRTVDLNDFEIVNGYNSYNRNKIIFIKKTW